MTQGIGLAAVHGYVYRVGIFKYWGCSYSGKLNRSELSELFESVAVGRNDKNTVNLSQSMSHRLNRFELVLSTLNNQLLILDFRHEFLLASDAKLQHSKADPMEAILNEVVDYLIVQHFSGSDELQFSWFVAEESRHSQRQKYLLFQLINEFVPFLFFGFFGRLHEEGQVRLQFFLQHGMLLMTDWTEHTLMQTARPLLFSGPFPRSFFFAIFSSPFLDAFLLLNALPPHCIIDRQTLLIFQLDLISDTLVISHSERLEKGEGVEDVFGLIDSCGVLSDEDVAAKFGYLLFDVHYHSFIVFFVLQVSRVVYLGSFNCFELC